MLGGSRHADGVTELFYRAVIPHRSRAVTSLNIRDDGARANTHTHTHTHSHFQHTHSSVPPNTQYTTHSGRERVCKREREREREREERERERGRSGWGSSM